MSMSLEKVIIDPDTNRVKAVINLESPHSESNAEEVGKLQAREVQLQTKLHVDNIKEAAKKILSTSVI